jgi:Tfp pilus assembly protein PilX
MIRFAKELSSYRARLANELTSCRVIELVASRRGIATLPTILALMVLLLALAIGITYTSTTENSISGEQSSAAQALQYAEAGARDALQRITRDKTYNCPGLACYSIDFSTDNTGCSASSACAQVGVSNTSGTAADPKYVTSTGQAGDNIRRVEVTVIFDSSWNGQIATSTWREVTQ